MEHSINNDMRLPPQIDSLQTALENSERENVALKTQLDSIIGALGNLDFPKLLQTIEKRLDASEARALSAEKRLREELTARIAVNIEPYLEKTVRRVSDLNEGISAIEEQFSSGQETLEERFSLHQKNVAAEGGNLINKLTKTGGKIVADWQASQKTVQHNLEKVNDYAMKIYEGITDLHDAQNKIERAGNNFAQRMFSWTQATEELERRNTESCRTLVQEQEQASLRIRAFGAASVKDYKSMAVAYTLATVFVMVVSTAFFWILTYNRANSEIEQIKEFTASEQQKIGQVFEESVKDANIRNMGDDIKLKVYPFLLSRMPPQFKNDFDVELKQKIEELKTERAAKNTGQTQAAYQKMQKQSEK